jgi:hypothetical protein
MVTAPAPVSQAPRRSCGSLDAAIVTWGLPINGRCGSWPLQARLLRRRASGHGSPGRPPRSLRSQVSARSARASLRIGPSLRTSGAAEGAPASPARRAEGRLRKLRRGAPLASVSKGGRPGPGSLRSQSAGSRDLAALGPAPVLRARPSAAVRGHVRDGGTSVPTGTGPTATVPQPDPGATAAQGEDQRRPRTTGPPRIRRVRAGPEGGDGCEPLGERPEPADSGRARSARPGPAGGDVRAGRRPGGREPGPTRSEARSSGRPRAPASLGRRPERGRREGRRRRPSLGGPTAQGGTPVMGGAALGRC